MGIGRSFQRTMPQTARIYYGDVAALAALATDSSGRVAVQACAGRRGRSQASDLLRVLAHVREGEGASEAEAALIADVLADRAVAEALA